MSELGFATRPLGARAVCLGPSPPPRALDSGAAQAVVLVFNEWRIRVNHIRRASDSLYLGEICAVLGGSSDATGCIAVGTMLQFREHHVFAYEVQECERSERRTIPQKETVCTAIEAKQMLLLRLADGRVRLVEPYAFGQSSNGDDLLFVFQVRGAPGELLDWTLLSAASIEAAQVATQHFIPRAGYQPNHVALDALIYCQIV